MDMALIRCLVPFLFASLPSSFAMSSRSVLADTGVEREPSASRVSSGVGGRAPVCPAIRLFSGVVSGENSGDFGSAGPVFILGLSMTVLGRFASRALRWRVFMWLPREYEKFV